MAINFTELRELLGVISQSNITEFSLKSGDFEVSVRKDAVVGGVSVAPQAITPPS
ncbi:acetyl-CoA carboxylase, biotin carboxyl carrier protein, partial [Synechocystis sp. LEGE 06083]|nr:acetyl-CoA carboxylase, biotin carboxyl carrier protein [Synechocystis sp. LEGE 06083]